MPNTWHMDSHGTSSSASKVAALVVLMMISSEVDSVWILRFRYCDFSSSKRGSWCLPSAKRCSRTFQVEELPPSVPSAQAQAEACRFFGKLSEGREAKWNIRSCPYPLYIYISNWKGTILETRMNWCFIRIQIAWSFLLATCNLCDENMCVYMF